jgi:hypothetical protein
MTTQECDWTDPDTAERLLRAARDGDCSSDVPLERLLLVAAAHGRPHELTGECAAAAAFRAARARRVSGASAHLPCLRRRRSPVMTVWADAPLRSIRSHRVNLLAGPRSI